MVPVRLYLLDDHALFREGLLRLLSNDQRYDLVGQSGVPSEAIDQILTTKPHVLILDYDLGSETALQFMTTLRGRGFEGRVLLVTAGLPDADALKLIQMGLSGIFHKQQSPEDLQRAIVEVASGRVLIDQEYLRAILVAGQAPTIPRFTERERATMRLLLQGKANKEIAAEFGVSESAVKATLQQLFSKTGVRTRSQLVLLAIERYRNDI
ncbi:LuxR C-terminal-related transcriptional regulator [Granulicella cerasi]|uniref:LuxR C-terminal-related transcriptional regulator n=1 Tax=Granulicella cerasi TaxID=741063 RepID=A0ABW1Z819_9BACT|nr:response regulator transcription factor [Granulicella cerasi]